MKSKILHIILYWIVNLLRLLLAATFIFSGFVKAVDPIGMLYKVNAYFDHWQIPFEENSLILKAIVVSLATIEFILGMYLLLGIRKRFTTIMTFMMMLGMTLLTTYIYAYNPVADCGCFGEALEISNSHTLIKNIFLLCASILLLAYSHYMKRLISERNQWLTSIYSWIYIIGLSFITLHYLPIIDFTAFKTGTDIKTAWYGESNQETPEDLLNFALFNENFSEEKTEEILNDTGYTFLMTMPNINIADDGCNDRINDIFDECQDNDYKFYAVVGDQSNRSEIDYWIDRTGSAYKFLKCDATLIKSMVRSNPGLLLLKNGVIINKWSNNNLPILTEDDSWGTVPNAKGRNLPLIRLILWFIIPLIIIITLDGIWVGSKYIKHYIFKRTLKK